MSALEDLGDAISDALDSAPVSDVLSVLTGSMVGLLLELTRRSGNDPEKTITIDGGPGQRKVTVHALDELPNTTAPAGVVSSTELGDDPKPRHPSMEPFKCPVCGSGLVDRNGRRHARQRGTKMLFDQERMPAPDEYGYFFHPDIPGEDEGDDVRAMIRDLGYGAAVVEFEYDAPDALHDDYYEREDQTAVGRWTPTAPDGDGWVLVAKYDTEDGPCALFVTPNTGDPR